MKRIAINGLGRVGRLLLRRYIEHNYKEFAIVAVNDPMPTDTLAYLMKYDSVHGRADFSITAEDNLLGVDHFELKRFSETDPERLPWEELEIDVVIECSGRFCSYSGSSKHISAGATRVLIGAPYAEADITLVLGVNDRHFDPEKHFIVSNASCTTNSLAPPLKVLDSAFGVERALVTTVHSYTSSQTLVDTPANKKHRGRSGAINIIPTSTGADAATALVLPQLEGRLSAVALRVPVADGALTDISAELDMFAKVEDINEAFRQAAAGSLSGILAYSDEELVSSDILGDSHSAIIHGLSTRVIDGTLVKVQAWYDNEYGYACRCLDVIEQLPI